MPVSSSGGVHLLAAQTVNKGSVGGGCKKPLHHLGNGYMQLNMQDEDDDVIVYEMFGPSVVKG